MVRRLWVPGAASRAGATGFLSRRTARPLTACGALLLACESFGAGSDPPQISGGFGVAGSFDGSGGFGGELGGGATPGRACVVGFSGRAAFIDQVVRQDGPMPRVLYSWTTREQIAALRADRQLFMLAEQQGLGRGFAFEIINRIASDPSNQYAPMARLLAGELFAKIRYSWPNPWATRRAWPGEDYGDQLVRIVLKDNAWVAKVALGAVRVVDLNGSPVAAADVLSTPERIGAILFVKDSFANGLSCGGVIGNTFGGGAITYREFILGNMAMVEEWSLGTAEIRERLVADAQALTQFLDFIRPCPPPLENLGLLSFCAWQGAPPASGDELQSYLGSLALPSQYYGSVPEIAATIDLLRGDLFEPDPLVVKSGE